MRAFSGARDPRVPPIIHTAAIHGSTVATSAKFGGELILLWNVSGPVINGFPDKPAPVINGAGGD